MPEPGAIYNSLVQPYVLQITDLLLKIQSIVSCLFAVGVRNSHLAHDLIHLQMSCEIIYRSSLILYQNQCISNIFRWNIDMCTHYNEL